MRLTSNPPQVKKVVSYAESSDEEGPFKFNNASATRRRTRARQVVKDEDDYDENDDVAEEDGRFCILCDKASANDHR